MIKFWMTTFGSGRLRDYDVLCSTGTKKWCSKILSLNRLVISTLIGWNICVLVNFKLNFFRKVNSYRNSVKTSKVIWPYFVEVSVGSIQLQCIVKSIKRWKARYHYYLGFIEDSFNNLSKKSRKRPYEFSSLHWGSMETRC